jgi:hypothetical protein
MNTPNIIADFFVRRLQEHYGLYLQIKSHQTHKWENQRGLYRLLIFIKVEIGSWREAARELKRLRDKNRFNKV